VQRKYFFLYSELVTSFAKFQNRSKQADSYVPRQAWRSADSPMELGVPANQRRVPEMLCNLQAHEQDLMSVTSGTQSHLTHRAEEMSNEWYGH
jgi:hypothetical protein